MVLTSSPTRSRRFGGGPIGAMDDDWWPPRRGVWEYAEGTAEEPDREKDKKIWRQNNAIAVGIIKGTLSDVQLGHVMGITDAETAWNTLREIHQFSDRTRLKGLLAEFMKFRLDTTGE
jgi:hypothetical protein